MPQELPPPPTASNTGALRLLRMEPVSAAGETAGAPTAPTGDVTVTPSPAPASTPAPEVEVHVPAAVVIPIDVPVDAGLPVPLVTNTNGADTAAAGAVPVTTEEPQPEPPAGWQSSSLRWCNNCGNQTYYKKGWCNTCGWVKKKDSEWQKALDDRWKRAKKRQSWKCWVAEYTFSAKALKKCKTKNNKEVQLQKLSHVKI